eukprot:GHVH01009322.1.p1 GENE.GHVH01009322.1~~GHVH01009322.1.p1  ORF type:complete len:1270 (+),score=164.84 GHVH01009322.1:494-3811(+)
MQGVQNPLRVLFARYFYLTCLRNIFRGADVPREEYLKRMDPSFINMLRLENIAEANTSLKPLQPLSTNSHGLSLGEQFFCLNYLSESRGLIASTLESPLFKLESDGYGGGIVGPLLLMEVAYRNFLEMFRAYLRYVLQAPPELKDSRQENRGSMLVMVEAAFVALCKIGNRPGSASVFRYRIGPKLMWSLLKQPACLKDRELQEMLLIWCVSLPPCEWVLAIAPLLLQTLTELTFRQPRVDIQSCVIHFVNQISKCFNLDKAASLSIPSIPSSDVDCDSPCLRETPPNSLVFDVETFSFVVPPSSNEVSSATEEVTVPKTDISSIHGLDLIAEPLSRHYIETLKLYFDKHIIVTLCNDVEDADDAVDADESDNEIRQDSVRDLLGVPRKSSFLSPQESNPLDSVQIVALCLATAVKLLNVTSHAMKVDVWVNHSESVFKIWENYFRIWNSFCVKGTVSDEDQIDYILSFNHSQLVHPVGVYTSDVDDFLLLKQQPAIMKLFLFPFFHNNEIRNLDKIHRLEKFEECLNDLPSIVGSHFCHLMLHLLLRADISPSWYVRGEADTESLVYVWSAILLRNLMDQRIMGKSEARKTEQIENDLQLLGRWWISLYENRSVNPQIMNKMTSEFLEILQEANFAWKKVQIHRENSMTEGDAAPSIINVNQLMIVMAGIRKNSLKLLLSADELPILCHSLLPVSPHVDPFPIDYETTIQSPWDAGYELHDLSVKTLASIKSMLGGMVQVFQTILDEDLIRSNHQSSGHPPIQTLGRMVSEIITVVHLASVREWLSKRNLEYLHHTGTEETLKSVVEDGVRSMIDALIEYMSALIEQSQSFREMKADQMALVAALVHVSKTLHHQRSCGIPDHVGFHFVTEDRFLTISTQCAMWSKKYILRNDQIPVVMLTSTLFWPSYSLGSDLEAESAERAVECIKQALKINQQYSSDEMPFNINCNMIDHPLVRSTIHYADIFTLSFKLFKLKCPTMSEEMLFSLVKLNNDALIKYKEKVMKALSGVASTATAERADNTSKRRGLFNSALNVADQPVQKDNRTRDLGVFELLEDGSVVEVTAPIRLCCNAIISFQSIIYSVKEVIPSLNQPTEFYDELAIF